MLAVGAMRVKNEARWIRRSIESILPICDRIFVFDDHSTDATIPIARECGAEVFASEFAGLDEVRDKNLLLDIAMEAKPDWIVMIDGDEVLSNYSGKSGLMQERRLSACEMLRAKMEACVTGRASHRQYRALAFPVLYLWDREDQIRVDGVYRNMSRVSAFRPGPERFRATGPNGFHCGNCPQDILDRDYIDTPLLHFGYIDRMDRLRKWKWYNVTDPFNDREDRYIHVVQGDIPESPAHAKFKHGGPLELRSL